MLAGAEALWVGQLVWEMAWGAWLWGSGPAIGVSSQCILPSLPWARAPFLGATLALAVVEAAGGSAGVVLTCCCLSRWGSPLCVGAGMPMHFTAARPESYEPAASTRIAPDPVIQSAKAEVRSRTILFVYAIGALEVHHAG